MISIDLQTVVQLLLYLLIGNFIAIIDLYICYIEKSNNLSLGWRLVYTLLEIFFWPFYLLLLVITWSKGEI